MLLKYENFKALIKQNFKVQWIFSLFTIGLCREIVIHQINVQAQFERCSSHCSANKIEQDQRALVILITTATIDMSIINNSASGKTIADHHRTKIGNYHFKACSSERAFGWYSLLVILMGHHFHRLVTGGKSEGVIIKSPKSSAAWVLHSRYHLAIVTQWTTMKS